MNDLEKERILLEVMRLNDKSNYYFWGTVLSTVGMIASVISAFHIGNHFLFLAGAFYVLARLILMPKGIGHNQEAKKLLESIHD